MSTLNATPLGSAEKFCSGLPVQSPTVTTLSLPAVPTATHLPSIADVMVPLLFQDHAPLHVQSLLPLHECGVALHPQLQLTVAPSFVSQPSISQQPPPWAAILNEVHLLLSGLTPPASNHCCSTLPATHGVAVRA